MLLEDSLSEGDETSSSNLDETWIQWYCRSVPGHDLFCEVDRAFITDNFNLFGIRNIIPSGEYSLAMDLILDRREAAEGIDRAASVLYGLIHARYILTTAGLEAMREKYMEGVFGHCPREHCCQQPMLPIGLHDDPFKCAVKFYCPKCQDVYASPNPSHNEVDGAFFTTTFPGLFYLTYNDLVPEKPETSYVPRVFGFKIHPSSRANPRAVVAPRPPSDEAQDEDSWEGSGGGDSRPKFPPREEEARRKLTSTHNTPEILTGHKRKVDDNAEDSTSQVPVKRIVIDLVSGASGSVLEEKGDTQNGSDASLKK